MKKTDWTDTAGVFALAAAITAATGSVSAGGLVDVDIDFATDFPDPLTIDNPYWPLMQGMTYVYHATDGDECSVTNFVVTGLVKNDFAAPYDNITARVIDDTEWDDTNCDGIADGDPVETTKDWYAQDKYGHIWYFGEQTMDNEGSTEGSWEAGQDVADIGNIAKPGIIMLAHPDVSTDGSVLAAPGLFYRQEYYEDEAEDWGKVKRLNAKVTLGMENDLAVDDYTGCLKTKEWAGLDPGQIEFKYYCPYVGLVLVEEAAGGKTVREELVNVLP